jgi:hypothetical protein
LSHIRDRGSRGEEKREKGGREERGEEEKRRDEKKKKEDLYKKKYAAGVKNIFLSKTTSMMVLEARPFPHPRPDTCIFNDD